MCLAVAVEVVLVVAIAEEDGGFSPTDSLLIVVGVFVMSAIAALPARAPTGWAIALWSANFVLCPVWLYLSALPLVITPLAALATAVAAAIQRWRAPLLRMRRISQAGSSRA